MKLALEVELDWINDEMNVDETIRQNVIDAVVAKIQKNVEAKVSEKINQIIDSTIVNKIDELTSAMFTDFTNKQVTLTDGYGSKLKVYENVTAIVKEKFDNFMTQSVDDNGNPHSGYGSKFQRIEFIIDKQLKDFAKEFTTNAVSKVSAEIKNHVTDGLTTKLGAELMKVLKVEKMLQIN